MSLPAPRARFDVWHEVPLVPQLTGMSCWAAAAAMLVGWRDCIDIDPEELAGGVGRWELYRDGLLPADVDEVARAWGLHHEPPRAYGVASLRALLERCGPLWMGEASPGLHVVVVAGMHGDGSPDGTYVRVVDPWPVGRGERYTLTFRELMRNFEAVADVAGVRASVLHTGGRGPRIGARSARALEVVGANELQAVCDPLAVPHRWICQLHFRRANAEGRATTVDTTGVLVGRRHVLTVAHNLVCAHSQLGRLGADARTMEVRPGYQGPDSAATLGPFRATGYWVHPRWDEDPGDCDRGGGAAEFDYGIILLDSGVDAAAVRGAPLGFWDARADAAFERIDPAELVGRNGFVAGYASRACVDELALRLGYTLPHPCQLVAQGPITDAPVRDRIMGHEVDTCAGQSGAPLWVVREGVHSLVGIHAGAGNFGAAHRNFAIRVTQELLRQVRRQIDRPRMWRIHGD